MTKQEKILNGRRLSALRNGLREARARLDDLVPILEQAEPDAAHIAREGSANSTSALKRERRIAEGT